MDLYSITQSLWRHKFATLPIILLTIVGCFGIAFVKAPTYTTTATYILSPPPAPATPAQIAQNPKLRNINSNNPFMNYGGLPIVAQELTTVLSTPQAEATLKSEGATGSYIVAPSQLFGNGTPLIQLSALGTTPEAALGTVNLVGRALITKMNQMQATQRVASYYRIKTLPVTAPSAPTMETSSKLRDLIAVLAIGLMLTFVLVSILNALDERAVRRRERQAGPAVRPYSPNADYPNPDQLEYPRSGEWVLPDDPAVGDLIDRPSETGASRFPVTSSAEAHGIGIGRRRYSS